MGSKCARVHRDCLDFLSPKTRNRRGSRGMEHEINAAIAAASTSTHKIQCPTPLCISGVKSGPGAPFGEEGSRKEPRPLRMDVQVDGLPPF